ncbi:class I SAM-dependent methyltransferase family protein, partial [Desulfosarcina sp. OttesenSCG-928-G10]|nr:class I SAM-dependent methyltransferase family protein [Desulfosarcina sp. OttesenSCG-928-G10]
ETPLSLLSPKGLYFALARQVIRHLGRFSNGMKLGLETGFDSGSTLDYVYRNAIGGTNSIGRLLDRTYLESPGWTGIRARKRMLQELLGLGVRNLREAGLPVRVMDVAAGHGRYVLDTLEALGPDGWDGAVLRDFSPLNVEQGTARIQERGLADKVSFVKGDAFDAQDLASVMPKPTLAVVSGLYELFPENDLVLTSLKGIAAAVQDGGYLAYTNQPWHPQQEFIARVLTSHRDGIPWVMRCRSQAEMDYLVAEAGFEKVTQRIEPQGIFTVSLARRNAGV